MNRLLPLLLLTSCIKLDFLVFNGVHCTAVGPASCEDRGIWDQVCASCDEPYDWTFDHPWEQEFPDMLDPGESIRPIDASTITSFRIDAGDGEGILDAYFIPAHGEVAELSQTTILYNHGNYAGIEHYLPRLRMLHELGANVYVWDYRGYGKSEPDSHPSAEEFLSDARLVWEQARDVVPDPGRVVIYANSLGGVPAVEMAITEQPCALVMEAALTAIGRLGQRSTTVTFGDELLTNGLFDNMRKLDGYSGALFALIGDEDQRFAYQDWAEVIDNATGPKRLWVLPGVEHGIDGGGVPEADFSEYSEQIRDFLREEAPACLGG